MNREASISDMINYLDNESTKVSVSYTMLTTALALGVKANEWLIICLIESMNNEEIPVPSIEKMGEMVGLSDRQVYQIIKSLKSKGFLVTKKEEAKVTTYDFSPLRRQIKLWQINTKQHYTLFRSIMNSVK